MVSGKVKDGETVEEAALRETWEESGFAASQLRRVDGFRRDIDYRVRGYTKRVTYFLAELIEPEADVSLSSREHVAFKWATLSDVKKTVKYRDIASVIRAAHELIAATVPHDCKV